MDEVFKKLNYKNQKVVCVLNAPESFEKHLEFIRLDATLHTNGQQLPEAEFMLAFAITQTDLDTFAEKMAEKLQGDGLLWIAYPKGSSKKYSCEFNRDKGWDILGKLGFEGVRQIAIDEDWSVLRFRRVKYIKTLNRRESMALTKEGKERTKKE